MNRPQVRWERNSDGNTACNTWLPKVIPFNVIGCCCIRLSSHRGTMLCYVAPIVGENLHLAFIKTKACISQTTVTSLQWNINGADSSCDFCVGRFFDCLTRTETIPPEERAPGSVRVCGLYAPPGRARHLGNRKLPSSRRMATSYRTFRGLLYGRCARSK